MISMIGSVAQAMLTELKRQCDVSAYLTSDLSSVGLEDAWIDLNALSRAAIKAMREPTLAMLEAGYDQSQKLGADSRTHQWRTMIDAALGKAP